MFCAAALSMRPESRRCTIVILITGATGFIGRRVADALARAGHEVVCALRDPAAARARGLAYRAVQADFARDLRAADWRGRLDGVEVVVNAVGILREGKGQHFATLHVAGPCALFEACIAAGVRRVVQISALGADEGARSAYHLSKKKADDFLLSLPISSVIVQPSLVYGPGGASARLFTGLASLPVIPLPGGGGQRVQPVYVDDAVRAIVALAERDAFRGERVPLVGPEATTLRGLLADLRGGMGLPPARVVAVPMGLVRIGASLGSRLPGSLLDTETLDMLERGNTGPADAIRALIGGEPRAPAQFIERPRKADVRTAARLAWLLPVLRASIAIVWIVTGIVSLGVYPVEESYALLARVGAGPALAPWLLYGAALLDLAIGVGILVLRGQPRRWLWLGQIALILGYTVIITFRLPEFWLHPYGPILKNLPMLAALWLLYEMEER